MAEVAASVALAEAGAPAATPAPAGKTVDFSDGRTVSFVDTDGADPADTILDEVLSGEPATETTEAKTDETPEAKADGEKTEKAAEPAKVEAKTEPAPDAEALKLRRGFAKLGEERQKLIEQQNEARATIASAQQYAEKARKHDELISSIEKDPAGFLLAHGGETLVQKALQGFIEQEKSPAEREGARLRADWEADKAAEKQRKADEQTAAWRNGVISKVQADERFDLVNAMGLHEEVLGVMAGYYQRYSKKNEKGEVIEPALLPWDTAAQAVEESRGAMLEKSKRYGKRQPAAAAEPTAKKETPSAKQSTAPAKKAPTSLSSVPVADSPQKADELSLDPDERERQLLAELGV